MKNKLLLVLALLLIVLPNFVFALGVSPSGIELHNIKSGSEVNRSVFLSRKDATKDTTIHFIVEKGGTYIHPVANSNDVVFPAGENRVEIPFVISAVDLTPGEYSGQVLFQDNGLMKELKAIGANSAPSIHVSFSFSVTTDEMKEVSVSNILGKSSGFEKDTFSVIVDSMNKGNIADLPVKIEAVFTNSSKSYTYPMIPTSDALIPAFESKRVEYLAAHLPPTSGRYKVAVNAYNEKNELIYASSPFSWDFVQTFDLHWLFLIIPLGALGYEALKKQRKSRRK